MIIKCRICGCGIYANYEQNSIKSLNIKTDNKIKYFSELLSEPSEDCHTGIYLTCYNNHTQKYFFKIEIKNKQ